MGALLPQAGTARSPVAAVAKARLQAEEQRCAAMWGARRPAGQQGRAQPWRQRRQQRRCCHQRCQRPTIRAAALGKFQLEGPLLSVAELLGYTGDDPGHWNFSPEWYGTQGGGWGRDAGVTVFAAHSECGNGQVSVTAHPATSTAPAAASPGGGGSSSGGLQEAGGDGSGGSWEEWRVLRFNGVTRQTVMRVTVTPADVADPTATSAAAGSVGGRMPASSRGGGGSSGRRQPLVAAQPDCLAQEYLKSMAAVAAAVLGLQRLLPAGQAQQQQQQQQAAPPRLRALCIGVGGGSLPLFLAHHFRCMDIDAVELDPAVLAAATSAMGLPPALPNLHLHCADAEAFLRQQAGQAAAPQGPQQAQQGPQQAQQPCYDLVLMDAFDGEDEVPAPLCTPAFAALVGAALHPQHGSLILNLHSMEEAAGRGQGGAAVAAFRAALLGQGGGGSGGGGRDGSGMDSGAAAGSSFAVAAQRQRNACVAVARGLALPADRAAARRWLFFEASRVAEAAGYRFPAGSRACRELRPL